MSPNPMTERHAPVTSCQVCGTNLPDDADIVSDWECECGHWKIMPVADAQVHRTKNVLRDAVRKHVVLGPRLCRALGMEQWALLRAMEEEPALTSALYCPN